MKISSRYEFLKLGNKPPLQTQTSMKDKVVLITGATSGIGLAASHRFAKGGARLIFIVRNKEKAITLCNEIKHIYGTPCSFYLADFSDLNAVKKAVLQVIAKEKQLDVLINNAGIYLTKRTLSPHGYELALTVNHLASLLITEQLIPLLNQSKGRVIQVNSEGHRFSGFPVKDPHFKKRFYTGLRSYGASKTAQLHTVWELADKLKEMDITINAMHPGAVESKIGLNNGWLYRMFKTWIINRLLKKVDDSAEALYYLAAEPSIQKTTGKYFYLTHETLPAKHAHASLYSKKVLQLSFELIGECLK